MLTLKERGALRLSALDPAAVKAGLRPGMALADARALVPNLASAEGDTQADLDSLLDAAALAERFTPLVALDGTDGLTLDITGCAHLFGDERGLARRTRRAFASLGLGMRGAIAGTPQAARLIARHGNAGIIPPGGEEEAARTLPVAALEQERTITLALSRAGLKTLGDLAERPSHLIAARFGQGLVDALHRALGREDIRITPLRSPPEILSETHFPEPLALMASLMAALERLARDCARMLEQRALGGRSFEASFFRSDGKVRRLTIETAEPLRDVAGMMRLTALRIETLADPLDPGFGFDSLRFAVLRSEPMAERQPGLGQSAGAASAEQGVAALIDRLIARFGRSRVLKAIAAETHDPLRAAALVPHLSGKPSSPWPQREAGEPPARPLTLFTPPQPVEALAEVPDGPPLRFRWRRMLHEVVRAEGPERIAPEWWRADNDRPTRDYYRVEDGEGRRFWLFREGFYDDAEARPRWFMHGLFA